MATNISLLWLLHTYNLCIWYNHIGNRTDLVSWDTNDLDAVVKPQAMSATRESFLIENKEYLEGKMRTKCPAPCSPGWAIIGKTLAVHSHDPQVCFVVRAWAEAWTTIVTICDSVCMQTVITQILLFCLLSYYL